MYQILICLSLSLNQQLANTRLESEKQQIQRAILHTEKEVDKLVYELYGLTKMEINIVEESIK